MAGLPYLIKLTRLHLWPNGSSMLMIAYSWACFRSWSKVIIIIWLHERRSMKGEVHVDCRHACGWRGQCRRSRPGPAAPAAPWRSGLGLVLKPHDTVWYSIGMVMIFALWRHFRRVWVSIASGTQIFSLSHVRFGRTQKNNEKGDNNNNIT